VFKLREDEGRILFRKQSRQSQYISREYVRSPELTSFYNPNVVKLSLLNPNADEDASQFSVVTGIGPAILGLVESNRNGAYLVTQPCRHETPTEYNVFLRSTRILRLGSDGSIEQHVVFFGEPDLQDAEQKYEKGINHLTERTGEQWMGSALACFRDALNRAPSMYQAQWGVASVLENLGEYSAALAWYRILLANPDIDVETRSKIERGVSRCVDYSSGIRKSNR